LSHGSKDGGKIIEYKDRLICIKVRSNNYKYHIFSQTPSLKGSRIFINEDLIQEDQAKLRKKVQKIKEDKKEGKHAIISKKK
jgi:hypothetical protein